LAEQVASAKCIRLRLPIILLSGYAVYLTCADFFEPCR
jgi:hypothetical protein